MVHARQSIYRLLPSRELKTRNEEKGDASWWLRLQLGLALAGGVIWLGGAFSESDFFAGLGAGLLIAALTLRLGRRAARHRALGRGADLGRDEAEDP